MAMRTIVEEELNSEGKVVSTRTTYTFDSPEEARAFADELYEKSKVDGFNDVKDAIN
jgi:hypothetical protein